MGMEVTTTPASASTDPYTRRTKQDIKNECGSLAANKTMNAIRIQKSKSTKKKKLNYNYKKISKQITMCNTSTGVRRVVTKAREEVVSLLRK